MSDDEEILLARINTAMTDFRPLADYAAIQVRKLGDAALHSLASDVAAIARLQGQAEAWRSVAKLQDKCRNKSS